MDSTVQADREGSLGRRVPYAALHPSRTWRRISWSPIRIIIIYGLVSFAWIAFSDRAVAVAIADPHARQMVETAKGWAFVVVTSFLLYALIRRAEAASRVLGAEVRATLDGMVDAVLLVDAAARIVEVNRAALDLLCVGSKEEILGPVEAWAHRFRLRTPDGAPIAPDRFASVRALSGERIGQYDALMRRADGREVFVSIAASPVPRPGERAFAVLVVRDVSASRRLDELRDEFLAIAAHEFKTPLAVVKAYAQLMKRRDEGETQALTAIERQVDRLARLVQHLLDASRVRLDAPGGRRERFDLGALAREAIERLRPAAPGRDLQVQAAPAAPVLADRERIARVLTCLLENAVRFSPDGGPIRARVEVAHGEARVSVEDRGVGIPGERQSRIFERYYRAHAGTSEDHGGLGLGLELSRSIVHGHGGRIWFESAPGEGSTFHFSLPLAEDAEGRPR